MRMRDGSQILMMAMVAITACGKSSGTSSTSPDATTVLTLKAGNAQSATVGHAVAIAPSVTVTSNGLPKAALGVTFSVASGGGSLTGASAVTDASGTAQVGSWTLGTGAGANTLSVSATGAASLTISATGTADVASLMSKTGGDAQTAPAGLALTAKPAVTVVDRYGNVVAGVGINFAVASGGGSLTGAAATTGANGVATVGGWTLGNAVGSNSATATATGLTVLGSPLTFTETGVAGPVATITKVAGDNISALVSSVLGTAPSVSLADQFGNLVSNQSVTFAVASGGGSVTGATPVSGANGVATVGSWTLGSTAGTNTLTAAAGSAPTATFTATGTAAVTLPSLAGSWHGTWVDTRYGVQGNITNIVLTQTASAFGGTGTIDLSSIGMGVANGTATGTISGNVVTFTFTAAGIGSGSGTLNGTAGSGTGGVTALNFGNFTFTGTASANLISGTFQFTSPSGGNGTITVTKP